MKLDDVAYLTVHGSRAYGLDRPDSDWDLRGFFLPEPKHVLGYLSGAETRHAVGLQDFGDKFPLWPEVRDADVTVWDIRKFYRLAAACNPNAVEILFTSRDDHVLCEGDAGKLTLANRHLFLSRRARDSFGGYAVSQLRKVRDADWESIGVRKDAMHLCRLLDFGEQILTTGDLRVKFDGAQRERLLDVRSGKITREAVVEAAEDKLRSLDGLLEKSPLPEEPDHEVLNSLLNRILLEYVYIL